MHRKLRKVHVTMVNTSTCLLLLLLPFLLFSFVPKSLCFSIKGHVGLTKIDLTFSDSEDESTKRPQLYFWRRPVQYKESQRRKDKTARTLTFRNGDLSTEVAKEGLVKVFELGGFALAEYIFSLITVMDPDPNPQSGRAKDMSFVF